jgi:UPF0042 nucleotide-binding protein
MSVHELRDTIAQRVEPQAPGRLSILFESFGFKHGVPGDADFVFDARTLPNPYWEPALQPLTGRDAKVIEFLEASPRSSAWSATSCASSRAGCRSTRKRTAATSRSRSAAPADSTARCTSSSGLARHFRAKYPQLLVRHNALPHK